MEKGMAIPEPPPKPKKKPRYLALRTWGIVLLCAGIAVAIGINAEAGVKHGLWGLIGVFMGIGMILSSALERNDIERSLYAAGFVVDTRVKIWYNDSKLEDSVSRGA